MDDLMSEKWDAVIVGSGPNGLAAAVEIARNGFSVCVLEGADTIGGGMRTRQLTLPGFLHDECSAIHPMGILSPYFRQLPLGEYGLEWLQFPASVAHPMDDGPAPLIYRSLDATAERLGADGKRWKKVFRPFLRHADDLLADLLGPLRLWPRRPLQMARFGIQAAWPATRLAAALFREPAARALFGGCAGHSVLPLDKFFTAALGLIFSITAHVEDWPCARGGSASIAAALEGYLRSLGGHTQVERPVCTLGDIPPARVVLFDLAPRPFAALAEAELPRRYVRRLRSYRYGPATFKVDWALDGPIPWADPAVSDASTVHVGGARSLGRSHSRASVFDSLPAESCRSQSCPEGSTHGIRLLPHSERVPGGHDRTHRSPDRTVRARLRRSHSRPPRDPTARLRTTQPQLCRRRGNRWRRRSHPALHATGRPSEPLHDAQPTLLSLLRLDATGRGRPRDVRVSCSSRCNTAHPAWR
jgi:hypothetical protein